MKTINITTGVVSLALATFLLSGCTGTNAAQQVPQAGDSAPSVSASATPSATATTPAPDAAGMSPEWGIDISKVDVNTVTTAYGADQAARVVPDALTTLSIATNEAADLHVARDAAGEALRYEIMRDRVTDTAWAMLMEGAATPDVDTTALGLMPHAPLDGDVDGATITSITAALLNAPAVAVVPGDGATGQRVTVTVTERITVALDGAAPMVADRTIALYMVPSADGGWLLDNWSWTNAGQA